MAPAQAARHHESKGLASHGVEQRHVRCGHLLGSSFRSTMRGSCHARCGDAEQGVEDARRSCTCGNRSCQCGRG